MNKIKGNRSAFLFMMACIFFISATAFNNKATGKYKLDFFTSNNQFYLCDSAYRGSTGSADFWTPDAYKARLGTAYDILGISTESFGHIKADLEVLDQPDTQTNFNKYDHVVEGGITIQSGLLQVLNFPQYKSCLKLIIAPGKYRVRVYSSGLANVDTEADEGQDFYRIVMWPDNNIERKVLKQFVKK
ncbi:MAG: hypothetical protein AAGC65_23765 [Mucilaginibacter sp.]|uniref:hypothetical protein n=1 Tax=Mucilaginibacter sp. TaxID=1882438 RepID=UPI0031B4D2E9